MELAIEQVAPLHLSFELDHVDTSGLLALVKAHSAEFSQNELIDDSSGNKRYVNLDFCSGKSSHSAEFSHWSKLLVEFIKMRLIEIQSKLELPAFQFYSSTAALTAYEDGAFFRPHTDNGSAAMSHRAITFVYYFYKEPKGFAGGELVLTRGRQRDVIVPRNKQLVVFDSSLQHEVLPVQCPNGKFEDARFSITGWILKRPSPLYRLKRKLRVVYTNLTQ